MTSVLGPARTAAAGRARREGVVHSGAGNWQCVHSSSCLLRHNSIKFREPESRASCVTVRLGRESPGPRAGGERLLAAPGPGPSHWLRGRRRLA